MFEILFHVACVVVAFAYSSVMECVLHKWVLHGLGKRKKNIFAFHWKTHHRLVRKNNFYDHQYEDATTGGPLRERISLYALVLAHAPLITVAPAFVLTTAFCARRYYKLHKRMHLEPEWAKKNFPWHWEHHMGKDQDKNWGVTSNWVDKLFGTSTI
tara:strand:+ start:357 stop:824 length:468 start_codon:yes stop_codon:yes gene_type:complete